MKFRFEPLVYFDEPDRRVVDLRRAGVPFVPLASRTVCRSTRSGPALHVHKNLTEIVYCVRGRLAFETAEHVYPFLPGDVFVSGPDQPHALRLCLKGAFVYRLLVAWPSRGRSLPGLTTDETAALARVLKSPDRRLFPAVPDVRKLFDRLFELEREPELGARHERRAALRLCALELLLAFSRSSRLKAERSPSSGIRELVEQMAENPVRDYDVAAMARALKQTPAAFRAAFKRAVGLPPHAYLIVCRIEAVKRKMSENPGASPTALAMDFGFSSVPHLATSFKRVTGMTYSEWQKGNK